MFPTFLNRQAGVSRALDLVYDEADDDVVAATKVARALSLYQNATLRADGIEEDVFDRCAC